MPVTICIARHGETDWNASGILQGWTDIALNDRGRAQAEELAAAMQGLAFAQVVTSPLWRARETAEIIAARLGLPRPVANEGLKERHFGIVQGVPKAELSELNPVLYQQILRRNPASRFEQGETMEAFATRVIDALLQIGAAAEHGCVLAITHGWVMDVVTRQVSGLPRSAILPMKRKNIERLWVEVDGDALRPRPAPA